MNQITIDVPDAALIGVLADPLAASREVRTATAIGLFAEGRLTHVQAARSLLAWVGSSFPHACGPLICRSTT